MGQITLHASGAENASGFSAPMTPASAEFIGLFIKISAVSGVLPSLTAKLQQSPNGTDWYDVPNGGAIVNLVGLSLQGATALYAVEPNQKILDSVRLAWTISGVGASFTFEALLGTV